MAFRYGETKRFPFDRTDGYVWYGIIEFDNKEISETQFTSSKSGKRDMVDLLKQLKSENRIYRLVGIWQGEWKTDLFVLDPDIVINTLQ